MRIVYLHQYFRTPAMSGGTRSYEFARRLVRNGHDVHVVTSDTESSSGAAKTWRTTVEAGVVVHWAAVPYRNAMSLRERLSAFGQFARLAAPRAASLEQDVVFATSTPLTIALPAVYSARRRRTPMVLEVRDLWPEVPIALGALRSPLTRRAATGLEGWAYRNAAHILALSPGMAAGVRARHPEAAVTVIPNGCDRQLFADADAAGRALRDRTQWLGDRPLILYAGTLGFVNDVGYLVRMAATLRRDHPDVRIAVVGQGAETAQVRAQAAASDVLDRNLFMFDQVPKAEVVAFFGACDLAVSTVRDEPALHANSANKVFDGWAAGRPVAVNHEGWIADILRRSGAGLVLPAGDPAAAATLVGAFLSDPARTATARAAARQVAANEFDRDLLFERFEDVLRGAVVPRQSARSAAGQTS
ncbi:MULTISPECIES: glycosyltransferase family 4 protein [Micromonospora]|uniref:glycosyltransferase family 4 protein n=1 Tax=Micromonospora TaxID=1873 RepID=UPI001EE87F77|nr:glycosyltransferase family 4 protein [Micromonospora hortensis]MCG5451986.1 glycosyltransferase family 4 protein [Micromonospora hortensis]WTI10309.1 glycosyltransferase family 4 protein [Micromonospora sp. NBC_00821]